MKEAEDKGKRNIQESVYYREIEQSLRQSDHGLAYIGEDTAIITFNNRFESLFRLVTGKTPDTRNTTSALELFTSAEEGVRAFVEARNGRVSNVKLNGPPGINCIAKIELALDPQGRYVGFFLRLSALANSAASQRVNFKSLLESSGDAVVIISPEGSLLYASPSVKDVLGYDEHEILKLDLYSAVHPDDLPENQKVMEKAILNPGIPIKGYPSRVLHKDGTYHWYDAVAINMIHDPDIGGIIDTLREIDPPADHRTMAPVNSEPNKPVADVSPIGTWETSAADGPWQVGGRFDAILGYSKPQSWTLESFLNHVHPDERPNVRKQFAGAFEAGGLQVEAKLLLPGLGVRWVEIRGKVLQHAGGSLSGTVLDVTELHQTREALFKTEDRLRKIADSLPTGLIITDGEGSPLYWNSAALQMHGFSSQEEALHRLPEFLRHFKHYDEDGSPTPFRNWPLPRLLRNEPTGVVELTIESLKKGWNKVFQYSGGSFSDVYGEKVHFLTISDVTALKKDRKTSKLLEERFWEAFHLSPVALAICRKADGICLDLNASAEKLLGYSYEAYAGKALLSINGISAEASARLLKSISDGVFYQEQEAAIATTAGIKWVKVFSVEQLMLDNEECVLSVLIAFQK